MTVLRDGGFPVECLSPKPSVYEPVRSGDTSTEALLVAVHGALGRRELRLAAGGPSLALDRIKDAKDDFRAHVAVICAREPALLLDPEQTPVLQYLSRILRPALGVALQALSPGRVMKMVASTRTQLVGKYECHTKDIRTAIQIWYETAGSETVRRALGDAMLAWSGSPAWNLVAPAASRPPAPPVAVAVPAAIPHSTADASTASALFPVPATITVLPPPIAPASNPGASLPLAARPDPPAAAPVAPEPPAVEAPRGGPKESSWRSKKTWGNSGKSSPPIGSEDVEATADAPTPPPTESLDPDQAAALVRLVTALAHQGPPATPEQRDRLLRDELGDVTLPSWVGLALADLLRR